MALTDQLIDAIIEKGEGDFSRDLSTPLASIFTMKFLGLPLEDWSDYAWFIQSASGGSSSVQPRTKNPSERELRERVAAEVVRQRTQPMAGGAIAHLLDATVDGRKLDSWEIEAYIWAADRQRGRDAGLHGVQLRLAVAQSRATAPACRNAALDAARDRGVPPRLRARSRA